MKYLPFFFFGVAVGMASLSGCLALSGHWPQAIYFEIMACVFAWIFDHFKLVG